MALPDNTFYDINMLPKTEGILVFPISMSRISNESQSPQTYWKYIEHFNPSKINKNHSTAKVGACFAYGDFLYLYSDEPANILKQRYMNLVSHHRNGVMKIVKGHPHVIHDAFSFKVWNQFYVDNDKFVHYFTQLQQIYQEDEALQQYIKEDFEMLKREDATLNENQINFFLEEHLLAYLISKHAVNIENDFIAGHDKWRLIAYPGKPPKALIYMHQKNIFGLESNNPYENSWYDLQEKKLWEYERVDLETIKIM